MLFYPLEDSLSFKRWPDQPLGLLGWQGIVPCKRVTMASTLVDVTLSRLLKISEVNSFLALLCFFKCYVRCLSVWILQKWLMHCSIQ